MITEKQINDNFRLFIDTNEFINDLKNNKDLCQYLLFHYKR